MIQNGFVVSFKNVFRTCSTPFSQYGGQVCFAEAMTSVGDGVAFAGVLKHLDVVQVVAEAADFVWGKAKVVHQK